VLRLVEASWQPASRGAGARPGSSNVPAADALSRMLLPLMLSRRQQRLERIDLLIAGCESSLWLSEQFAADLRDLFPFLNVECASANKMLGTGAHSPRKTFFSGTGSISAEALSHAAILLVSHSGQTFPTLHATRLLDSLAPGRVWLLVGTYNSQMERALASAHQMRARLRRRIARSSRTRATGSPSRRRWRLWRCSTA
jgi:hypothetical protein